MARRPRKEGARSKKRSKTGASGRRSAPKRPQKRARKSAAKPAKAAKRNRRPTGDPVNLEQALSEAQARQAATAEILKIIASSPDDVQPVFDAIVRTIVRVMRCDRAFFLRCEGDSYFGVATASRDGAFAKLATYVSIDPATNFPSRAIVTKKTVYYPDWSQIDLPAYERKINEAYGISSALFLPLLRQDQCIGVLVLADKGVNPFGPSDIALAESFRDQALIAIENARLLNETKESLQQQTATADVLTVIASSPTDVRPVLDAIVESACRLCEANDAYVALKDGDELVFQAQHGSIPVAYSRRPINRQWPAGRAVVDGKSVYLRDVLSSEGDEFPEAREIVRQDGVRTVLTVPLMRESESIGVIILRRTEVQPFTDKQMALLKTFADQAVIAIQNVRLFNETKESLERQTATSEVLQVISSSPGDLKPVFDQMLAKAMRLCEAQCGFIYQMEQDAMRAVAEIGVPPAFAEYRREHLHTGGATTPADIVRATKRPAHVHDARESDAYRQGNPNAVAGVELGGARTVLYVPMIKNDDIVGLINLYRLEVKPFTDEQIALLENFASQAVIAIENARLFNETRESLERQTATAEILKVIASSPDDVQPVFEAIAERSKELVGGHSTTVFRFAGDMVELVGATSVNAEADAVLRATFPMPVSRMQNIGPTLRGEISEIVDVLTSSDTDTSKNVALARGWRSRLVVPLKGDREVIGFISITRKEPGAFADKDKELVRTFADQAVIAIQNVELFEEVQARTRDLQESLQQQTATADVLKVISRSAFDLDTVMDTLARSALDLCGSKTATLFLREGDVLVGRGIAAREIVDDEFMRVNSVPLNEESHMGRAVLTGTIANIGDFENNPHTKLRRFQQVMGFKSFLAVPLIREGRGIGVFALTRDELGEFNQRQVDLVQGFADQAVIAIENTRLFNETTEALERQTATADILKVIASSPDDVQPVFQAIAERSNRLINGFAATVVSIVDDVVHLSAFTPTNPEADAAIEAFYPRPLSTFTYSEAIGRGAIYRIEDAEVDLAGDSDSLKMIRQRGWRSALWVPLMREDKAIGVIGVTRGEAGPFAEHHVEMLKTFADQAVIAISNVNLFQQVQQRTRELSQSLDDLRAAQDRLVQTEKLASLGQLTAGIAHEIKNPLNFVNNFSALSVELADELNDALKQAALAEKVQQEVDELTQLLKSNLEKVVQHGRRADSIVKNMLLHSREGSGEQRAADINALVEESLNLAYHGARAEKSGFNITLQRAFDAGAGSVELFPQEITRALLNLISNGFYAASKRKSENGEAAFEPTLLATTRDLGQSVEIRIRDNGTGIPPEVKEKMFNPFFTTKPAGEGTGLGLSMTHDIVVKQHGGTIDVATEPGNFTEFILVLPRANGGHGKSRGQA